MLSPYQLNLRHASAAVAIAETGSISKASASVNTSQPALTQALAKLETQLGHRLFERLPSGTVQTDAGHLFLARAKRGIDRLVESGRRIRRNMRQLPIPHLERAVTMGQLQGLVAIDRTGSYSRAARDLGLAQPTVHRSVSELEAAIGLPLVAREGRTIRVTPAGQRLVSSIRLMVAEFQSGLDELAMLLPESGGSIRIGALPLPRAGLLPETLAAFCGRHPFTRIAIIEGPYTELLTALRQGEIDLIVGALRETSRSRDITQTPLFEDDLFIVGRKHHPLAGRDRPSAAELSCYPWLIAASGAPMRASWERLMEGAPAPSMQIECGSVLIARGLLLGGDWLALMSRDQFQVEESAGLIAPIGHAVPGSRRAIGVTTRSDWLPTGEEAAFLDLLQAAGSQRSSAI